MKYTCNICPLDRGKMYFLYTEKREKMRKKKDGMNVFDKDAFSDDKQARSVL